MIYAAYHVRFVAILFSAACSFDHVSTFTPEWFAGGEDPSFWPGFTKWVKDRGVANHFPPTGIRSFW
jgi:hypothetical protein